MRPTEASSYRTSPNQQAAQWLAAFAAALEGANWDGALALFDDEVRWRQLSSTSKALLRCHRAAFTQDRKALAGKSSIRAMLVATVPAAKPARWCIDGEASESDGIVDAWFTFETTVSPGLGHLRLEHGKCWVLSTLTGTDGLCC